MLILDKTRITSKYVRPEIIDDKSNGIPVLSYDVGSIFDTNESDCDNRMHKKTDDFLLWCLGNINGEWTWTIDHLNVFKDNDINGKMIDQHRVILILTQSKKSAMLLKLSNVGIQNLKDIEFVNNRRVSRTFGRY